MRRLLANAGAAGRKAWRPLGQRKGNHGTRDPLEERTIQIRNYSSNFFIFTLGPPFPLSPITTTPSSSFQRLLPSELHQIVHQITLTPPSADTPSPSSTMATASGVVATGADFLQRENLDGNLRRVNSSSGEDTLIDLEEHVVEGTIYETDRHAGDKKLIPQYRLVAHGSDAQNPIQTSPPTINLSPILAQAIDTGTGLALGMYLGTLCYMLPSTFAIGRSPLGPSLFIVAKSLNYGKWASILCASTNADVLSSWPNHRPRLASRIERCRKA